MKILCPHSLYHVYGGRQGMPASTGCPDCDGELDLEQENAKIHQGFLTPNPDGIQLSAVLWVQDLDQPVTLAELL